MFKKILIVFIFLFLLITPELTISGALKGLDLWYKALIPSLMPFMFLSNIIINYNLTSGVNILMRPISKLLGLPKECGYSIFSGLLFGYPSCAITTSELYSKKQLDKTSALICICAFNNVSPAFISGYICMTILSDKNLFIPVFVIQYLTVLINSVIIKLLHKKTDTDYISVPVENVIDNKNIIENALNNSLINIARLGGYVVIFSIISNYISHYLKNYALIPCLLCEITSGVTFIRNNNLFCLLPFMYLGGVCSMYQTFAVDKYNINPKKKYIFSKLTGAAVSLILCSIYYVIRQ